ncbi:RnfH family protein [Enterovibrio norvegicus FF-33]|uniref:RnfH family protein n=1 Tax=Enterovibrio norvegicus TaxID=188144 RepID=UPI0002E77904|nr:RnfH family protein [Enterovibrio norvegicus]OEE69834.1 RnfH family protein [Enterovibrio norvegicus FF-33]
MSDDKLLHIEVIYALPDVQRVFKSIVTPDMHVEDIIRHSGILDAYPEIDLKQNKVGVFSRLVKLDALVHDGDRIEIYRPLMADPKEIRRRRAERMIAEGKSDPVTGGKVNPQRKVD